MRLVGEGRPHPWFGGGEGIRPTYQAFLCSPPPPKDHPCSAYCGDWFDRRGRNCEAVGWPGVFQRRPPIAKYRVARVERVAEFLAGLGLDVKRVVESKPSRRKDDSG